MFALRTRPQALDRGRCLQRMELNSLNQMGTVATEEHGKADGIEDQEREREREIDR